MKAKILNSKDLKKIKELLQKQFGIETDLPYVFLMNQKGRVYIVNRDIERVEFNRMRVSSMGIYFATWEHDELRLSMEGAQLMAPFATKNTLELTKDQTKQYFKGQDLELELDIEGKPFLILTYGEDIIGCARYKEGKLLNFHAKIHRTQDLII